MRTGVSIDKMWEEIDQLPLISKCRKRQEWKEALETVNLERPPGETEEEDEIHRTWQGVSKARI